jgi:mannose-6-phosphate isomerase-like protein (cupin superfamily)
LEVVRVGDTEVGRMTLQPGWKWSECIKPVVKTESCQAEHLGYAVSGRLHVVHNDGVEVDVGPGDAYVIHAGHDAWVLGQEPFVCVEFKSAGEFAKA